MSINIPKFGFIIIRHVNSEETNEYWKECYRCIRKFYSETIVIIDDNSNQEFIKYDDIEPINYLVIPSEFPQRGELLPYYYLWKFHLFEKAVIIHDSVFIQEKIDFESANKIQFLWNFDHNWNNEENEITKLHSMTHNIYDNTFYNLLKHYLDKNIRKGCYGVQCVIEYSFLCELQLKYNFFELIHFIKSRDDRMALERIFGFLCRVNSESEVNTFFGDIHGYTYSVSKYRKMYYLYSYENYIYDKENNGILGPIIKVWTGR